jgi:hypothetical protein
MSAADVLFISGAAGVHAAGINGGYDRTSETSDGYALYAKRGDKSMCMEHCAGQWQVKAVFFKGKDSCYAWVAGGCGAEACTSRQWMVYNGKTWAEAPLVKIVAEAEVCSCCMPFCASLTHTSNPPPRACNCFLSLVFCFCAGRSECRR